MVIMSPRHQSWADVAVFEDANAGKPVEIFLKEKGLEARTYDDKWFRYFLFLRPPRMTYRVQVRQSNFNAANDYLKAETPTALEKAIHCPSCDSLRISYPQMTRKFITPTILLHLGIIFHLIEHKCYCEHCHFTWSFSGENARPVPASQEQFPLS